MMNRQPATSGEPVVTFPVTKLWWAKIYALSVNKLAEIFLQKVMRNFAFTESKQQIVFSLIIQKIKNFD